MGKRQGTLPQQGKKRIKEKPLGGRTLIQEQQKATISHQLFKTVYSSSFSYSGLFRPD
jgi:hypothetical protein